MKLTEILKDMFKSDGGEVWVGGVRIDGLVLDNTKDPVVIAPVSSYVNQMGLTIKPSISSGYPGDIIKLYASSDVDFDTYEWSIESGDARFVDDINIGEVVGIISDVVNSVSVSLRAQKDDVVDEVNCIVDYVTGFFSENTAIVGPSLIDYTDPVRYEISSTVEPDSVSWEIIGGGTIDVDTDPKIAFVTADDSGDDILLKATLSKAYYNDIAVSKGVSVDKCGLASGTVERPAILYPEDWSYEKQSKIRISPFHGVSAPGGTNFQITPVEVNDWLNPIYDETLDFTKEIPISMEWFVEDYSNYYVRVQYIDDQGKRSEWSDPVVIFVNTWSCTATVHIPDIFNDGSCILSYTLMHDAHDTGNKYHGYWYGGEKYENSPLIYGARFDTGNYILSDYDFSGNYTVSFYVKLYSFNDQWVTLFRNDNHQAALKNGNWALWCHDGSPSDTVDSGVSAELNRWYHVVYSVWGNVVKIYIDGELVLDETTNNFSDKATGDLILGYWDNGSPTQNLNGVMNNFRVFRKQLSDDEIVKLSNETFPLVADRADLFLDDSAVVLLGFDGNLNDATGIYNGVWNGTGSYDYGKIVSGANFDGSNSIDISVNMDITAKTITFFMKKTSSGDAIILCSDSSEEYIIVTGDSNNYGSVPKSSIAYVTENSSSKAFYCSYTRDSGKFIFVAFVISDNTDECELYFDGIKQSATNNIANLQQVEFVKIGANQDNSYKFQGVLDQLRIFNRALTNEEIQCLYYEKPGLEFAQNPDPFYDNSGVVLYMFEDNANDEFGLHDGVWSGTEQYEDGVVADGRAAYFDGGSAIGIGNSEELIPGGTSFTISFWVKINSLNGNDDRIIGTEYYNGGFTVSSGYDGDNFTFSIDSDGTWVHTTFGTDFISSNFVNAVAIYDSTTETLKTYVNGVEIASNSVSNAWHYSRSDGCFYIGGDAKNNSSCTDPENTISGYVDNFRILNRALSDEEVLEIYNNEKPQ
jgi:hypothetical protein